MRKAEIIPDDSLLFRRIRRLLFNPKTRKFTEPAFMIRPGIEKGLSVNWDKYATAEQTSYDRRTKEKYCVGSIVANVPRTLNLDVVHTPSKKNRAHSTICGNDLFDDLKRYQIAGYLADACEPIIII